MLKQQHQFFSVLCAVADGAVVTVACGTAWAIRRLSIPHGGWPHHPVEYPKEALILLAVPIVLFSMRAMGLYLPRRDRSIANEALQIFKACFVGMLGLLAALYVLDVSVFRLGLPPLRIAGMSLDAGRVQLGALAIVLPTMLTIHRVALRVILRSLRRRGWNQRHVAIIGTGRLGQIVARTLQRNSWTGIRVTGFISHHDQLTHPQCMGMPVRGGLDDLEHTLDEWRPDAVYVALPGKHAAALSGVLARLERFPVDVRVVPDVNPRYVPQSMTVSELDGMPILSYRECPVTGLGGFGKRVLDIFGSLAALTLFGPLMLLISALVRLSGPGPVIFKQRRVSLGGQEFDIYKFRTMFHAADERALAARAAALSCGTEHWTRRNDPRVTPIGRWLRRTSVDELPQLFNVLAGDMSLVGPRPEQPELIARFREDWRGYMLRQHVKAGMTGWAQINGHRGDSSLRKRLQYDLFYIKNWSIIFDLKILVLTLFRGFVHRNAH